MKSILIWHVTTRSSVVHRHYGGTYCFCLQGRKVSASRNQLERFFETSMNLNRTTRLYIQNIVHLIYTSLCNLVSATLSCIDLYETRYEGDTTRFTPKPYLLNSKKKVVVHNFKVVTISILFTLRRSSNKTLAWNSPKEKYACLLYSYY
jgi:hypothetical protein